MSLTKATLLEKASVSKPELLGEFFGEKVYVKSVSEFQRSRRISQMFDQKNAKVKDGAYQRARCLTIIDHLCSKAGEMLFSEADINDIMELDALKLDILVNAIEGWAEKREGKLKGK